MYANDTSHSFAVVNGAIEGIMQPPALPSLLTPGSFARATSSPISQVGHGLAPARVTAQASDDPPSDHEPASGRPNNGSNKRKPAAKLNKTSKGKKKAKTTETTPSKRFVWSNAMIAALLEMRFGDKEVKKRVERADTNRKKALAWQYFASRLSEHLNVVVTSDQVSNKYKKLKCEYRQGENARSQTGNDGREDDTELWGILNSAFAGRTGIGGTTLVDADNDSDSAEEDLSFASPENRQKASPRRCIPLGTNVLLRSPD
ncbi:hypothetical protein PR003_g18353 [Phytophthora rubi]|uniref:Myb/SANT-like DNA-binding domain-containing protein n=1 Tax=Phytophthora rubi TaxID=129364 RepID=A0A6A3K9F8_9STRA|nr:hypothetical protein PR001_g22538 [Phytophthora rubi]KAE9003731.1 hypothetical protein PR002_g17252 [Phytophthora rubi]KAE9317972.1 hypothetical protein PR003_g18353 [Phytophthora rubi]